MAEVIIVTQAEMNQMNKELDALKQKLRVDIAQKLKEAIAQGDLSENAEYDAAREEQAKTQADIVALQEKLKIAQLVDTSDMVADEINLGSFVRLLDKEEDEELELTLVGTTGANSLEGKFSVESEFGKALMHHKVGDTIEVKGFEYEILEVRR